MFSILRRFQALSFDNETCHQYFTPGQDWLFNTKQRNGGKELEEAGVNVDGWGGSVMNKDGARLLAPRPCIPTSRTEMGGSITMAAP